MIHISGPEKYESTLPSGNYIEWTCWMSFLYQLNIEQDRANDSD